MMLFSISSFVALLAAFATLVGGASLKRQSGDNGSCAQLGRICAGDVQTDLSNLWTVESCLFAGVCFERNGSTLDGFYGNLWVDLGHTSRPPLTLYTPRVTQAVSNSIFCTSLESWSRIVSSYFFEADDGCTLIGLQQYLEQRTGYHSAELHRRILCVSSPFQQVSLHITHLN